MSVSPLGIGIAEIRGRVGEVECLWHEAKPPGGVAPTLYVHGVPNDGSMWQPFLERTGGYAPDLPGFGRSGKPAEFPYSIAGYADWLERFVADRELDRFSLVVHDWGVVGLELAQRMPERIARLVISSAVPFTPGYRWHRIARLWRRRVVGELMMGSSTKWGFKQLSRESNAKEGPLPDEFIDQVWRHFDHGTQRAILKLYRSAPESLLARAGERLGEIDCLSLVIGGERDPYLPTDFARAYADALGGPTRLVLLEDAGHWIWLDRPDAIDTVTEFLLAPGPV